MKIFRDISALPSLSGAGGAFPQGGNPFARGSVVTMGAFDGLHRGHQALIDQLIDKAQALGLPSVVVTLEPLPREYFAPLEAPPRLMSRREKLAGLARMGIDYLMIIRFNDRLRGMDAAHFAKDIFVDRLCCRHLIVGADFRLGRDASGGIELLESLGRENDFTVAPTAMVELGEEKVSSSRIRNLLQVARFEEAAELLGRGYTISGRVIYGNQLGSSIGVPTANIALNRLRTALSGVYTVQARIKGETQWHCGVANVGTRPTVNDSIKAVLEVHLLDFSGDLYSKRLQVRFFSKIREEQKFASLDLLREQIENDIEQAKNFFAQGFRGLKAVPENECR